ncbi:kinesin-like protein KIN-14Q [Malania oleifera]|uniref:kinesin-like protein KIN-14Q n=1 Tax=Malania oleifera TaxID=397392 RepID=UPI0025ADBD36|nr:kinesin-like protein KIN-14Q [Malania oleifera]
MEDHQWHDPLLITDVSWQEQSSGCMIIPFPRDNPLVPDFSLSDRLSDNLNPFQEAGVSPSSPSSRISTMAEPGHCHPDANQGGSMLGFSLTSPDLVVVAGLPDTPRDSYGVSDDFLKNRYPKNMENSAELSFEEGINGSALWPALKEDMFLDASFELLPPPQTEEKTESSCPVLSINVGSMDRAVESSGVNYIEDTCFIGGDTVRTDAIIGEGECFPLYQTARFGSFSYKFLSLESGNYLLDLHFAEIVFTDGPRGMRVFDVYVQEKKALSSLDIYARVGANSPLVISDLKTSVDGDEGLYIRFEGLMGSPIVCGISVRKDCHASFRGGESLEFMGMSQMQECNSPEDTGDCKEEGETQKLQRDYELQKKLLTEAKRDLKELRQENELKNRECKEAWNSLKELQNELMRKSMHVGSLAFAIEGQVKEKGKWFSSLRDLKRKLKILKMEQNNLSDEALACRSFLADMNEINSIILSKMNQQVDQYEDLKFKFMEGAQEQKKLYNKVLELKGNIRVFCRCRPLNTEEIAAGASMTIDFESSKDGELTVKSNGTSKKTFKFDAVFSPQADQVDVFKDTAPFATSVLDGYNACIFAYGQTGTGKTFTMEGTDEARGVNFRTLAELFRIIKERENIFRYDISVSVLEVYNEQIRDLLVSNTQPGVAAKRLEIRQVGEGIHHVPGLAEAHVNNMSEVWEVLQTGSNARAVGSTNANEYSSRSHCIHCVMVKGVNLLNGECTRSKLWLIDLAGSERVAKIEVQGERLKETQNINRSLSALGDVISALATKSPHIPFRNSKLTHLLQDSLGGDSKTLMFVQISPNECDLNETLCSLNFASRVRGIELGPAKKQLDSAELLKYKQMAEKSKLDIRSKELQIKKMEETVYGLDLKMKEKDLKNKSLQEKVRELESQLLVERKLARQHVDSKVIEQLQPKHQLKQEQEEQNTAAMRPPLVIRPFGSHKNFNESANTAPSKDQTNRTRPLAENISCKPSIPLPPIDSFVKYKDPMEKENNPQMAEHPPLPKTTGRASICTTDRQVLVSRPAPRRNSLIPLPNAPSSALFLPPSVSLPPFEANGKEDTDSSEVSCFPEQTPADSPKGLKSGGKKLNSVLRRSLQKKIQLKSPMQLHARKGGVNVAMERVRVSIGSKGRVAHRILLGNARRVGTKETQQHQNRKEKERGWNIGTTGKTVI